MDPEVKVTEKIKLLLNEYVECGKSEEQFIQRCLDETDKFIPFKVLHKAYKWKKKDDKNLWLNELLEDSDLKLPTYEPPTRNPELEARIQKLKREQENKEYKKMTRNVHEKKYYEPGSVGKELKQLNNQLLGVGNFVITVAGAFVFGYKGTEYAFSGPGVDTFTYQLMAGLVLGTIVFFADLYFLIKEDMANT